MLYFKIIDGQEVISPCTTLKIDGRWVSNPTEEMILADGWLPYTPPPVIPTPETEPDYALVAEAIKRILSTETEELSDEEALEVAALYPTWISQIGVEVPAGKRLWYDGRLWKVIQQHVPQEDWTPDTAVSLYTEVSIEEWPEWRQPTGAHDAYNAGDKVTHNGGHWISDADSNIWEPGVYGWSEA